MNMCDRCGHSHPDEVAKAWGLTHLFERLCADCWAFQTEISDAMNRRDYKTVVRLATRRLEVCI